MPKAKPADKLNDSINIPVPRAFKRRVIELAEKAPGNMAHTKYARRLLEKAVEREESLAAAK